MPTRGSGHESDTRSLADATRKAEQDLGGGEGGAELDGEGGGGLAPAARGLSSRDICRSALSRTENNFLRILRRYRNDSAIFDSALEKI